MARRMALQVALRVHHYPNNRPRPTWSEVARSARPLRPATRECHRCRSVESTPHADTSIHDRSTIPLAATFAVYSPVIPFVDAAYFRDNVRARINGWPARERIETVPDRDIKPKIGGHELVGDTGRPIGHSVTGSAPVVTLPANNDHRRTSRRHGQRSGQPGAARRRSGPTCRICPEPRRGVTRPCRRVVVRTAATTIGMPIAVECLQPSATRVRIGEPAHSPGRIHQPCWK
jgi:hypothetical protein